MFGVDEPNGCRILLSGVIVAGGFEKIICDSNMQRGNFEIVDPCLL
jgi:hypothetical protein